MGVVVMEVGRGAAGSHAAFAQFVTCPLIALDFIVAMRLEDVTSSVFL
jgi:hypothetical protein